MGTRLVAAGDVATGESEPGTLLEAVLGCTSARGCQWRSAVKSRSTARSMQSWEGGLRERRHLQFLNKLPARH